MNKRICKRIKSSMIVVLVILLMFSFTIDVLAAALKPSDFPYSISITSVHDIQYIYGDMPGGHITTNIKTVNDNKYVYCVEADEGSLDRNDVLAYEDEINDPGLVYLTQNGFPAKNLGFDDSQAYYVTQLAIWMYYFVVNSVETPKLDGYLINSSGQFLRNFTGGDNDNLTQTRLALAAYNLFNQAWTVHKNPPAAPSLTFKSGIEETLHVEGENLVSDEIGVNLSGASSYQVQTNNSNAIVTDLSGNLKTTFGINEKFKIKINSRESTDVEVTVNASATTNKVYQYKPVDSGKQRVLYAVLSTTTTPLTNSMSFNYQNNRKRVVISKKDASSSRELPGATLEIQDMAGNKIETWVSTSTPHEVFLDPGTYKLIETIAPKGYVKSNEEIEFTLNVDGTTSPQNIVMKNRYIEVPATGLDVPTIVLLSSVVLSLFGLALIYVSRKEKINY